MAYVFKHMIDTRNNRVLQFDERRFKKGQYRGLSDEEFEEYLTGAYRPGINKVRIGEEEAQFQADAAAIAALHAPKEEVETPPFGTDKVKPEPKKEPDPGIDGGFDLSVLSKEQLLDYAEKLGVPVNGKHTKEHIGGLIIKKIKGEDNE